MRGHRGRTLTHIIPLSRLNNGPSISNSFVPALTLVLLFPMKSSVNLPSSLSMTRISKSAMEGTFLTRHVSFHTGVCVLSFTADLEGIRPK